MGFLNRCRFHGYVYTRAQVFHVRLFPTALCNKGHPIKSVLTLYLIQWSYSTLAMHLISLSKRKKMQPWFNFSWYLFLTRTVMLLSNVPENKSAADLIKGRGVFLPSPPSAAVKRGPGRSATFGSDGGASTVSSRSWHPGCPVHARTIPHLKTCDAVLIYDASQPLKFNFSLRRAPLIAP